MALSVKQRVEAEVEKIESRIGPELKRLEELKSTLVVIDSLPVDSVSSDEKKPKRKYNRHKAKTRYGDKTIPQYITEIGATVKPLNRVIIRAEIKKRYGHTVKLTSISSAMSIMLLKDKTLHRLKKGSYILIGQSLGE